MPYPYDSPVTVRIARVLLRDDGASNAFGCGFRQWWRHWQQRGNQ
jgi:hypothetical protein